MIDFSKVLRSHGAFRTLPEEQIRAERAAIDAVMMKFGLRVSEQTSSPKTIRYKVKLNPDCNIRKVERAFANICIALNDDTITAYRTGADYIIEKHYDLNDIYLGDLITRQFLCAPQLALALGKDMEGHNTYTNLARAPHILVAGTTGAGKSILLHDMICSLLIKNPFISMGLVDTKKTEFPRYSVLPNVSVMDEAADAIDMLYNLCQEMERRYSVLSSARCRDIDEYRQRGGDMRPIVIVIDEFADLILSSAKQVEQYVVRLAQKSRACGIHLIIGTQRPTREVVTGLIKTNIPTRICLHVTSALDSRIVLDRKGGEKLAGRGDMLYLGNGTMDPIRISGCIITPDEIDKLTRLISQRR